METTAMTLKMPARPQTLAEALKDLKDSLKNEEAARSETGQLRFVFDKIETAFQMGAKREAVHAALSARGFTMTANSFKSAVQRIRAERKKSTQ